MNRLLSILVSLFVLFLIYLWINHIMTSPPHSEIDNQTSSRIAGDEEKSAIYDKYDLEKEDPQTESDEDQQESGPDSEEATSTGDPAGTSDSDNTEANVGEGGSDESSDINTEQTEEEAPAEVEEVVEAEPDPPAPDPEPVRRETTPPASNAETSDGVHIVIAGNFLERQNAQQRVNQLQENGFPNAQVINFELSQFHTVAAGRYNDLSEAHRVKNRLKDLLKIDAYVRNGN